MKYLIQILAWLMSVEAAIRITVDPDRLGWRFVRSCFQYVSFQPTRAAAWREFRFAYRARRMVIEARGRPYVGCWAVQIRYRLWYGGVQ